MKRKCYECSSILKVDNWGDYFCNDCGQDYTPLTLKLAERIKLLESTLKEIHELKYGDTDSDDFAGYQSFQFMRVKSIVEKVMKEGK